jgi:Asp/Glu/hydantoin racemase
MPKLAIVHTAPMLEPVFERLVRTARPDVETVHIVDEELLADAIANDGLTDANRSAVAARVREAAATGADAVLVTCSSIGEAVEAAAGAVGVPVVRVDVAMAQEAVDAGRRIGVLATLRSTLRPTAALIRRTARDAGREVEIVEKLCDGAYAALRAGDRDRHDALVRAGYEALRGRVDVVVLAQASMARILDALPEAGRHAAVLSSPGGAVERALAVI